MTTVIPPPAEADLRRDPRRWVIWVAVSVAGALAWGVLALQRGERISAVWLLVAALASYVIAYRFYARWIAHRVLGVDDRRATPAERLNDGVGYHPTDRRVLLGHHFATSGRSPVLQRISGAADQGQGRSPGRATDEHRWAWHDREARRSDSGA